VRTSASKRRVCFKTLDKCFIFAVNTSFFYVRKRLALCLRQLVCQRCVACSVISAAGAHTCCPGNSTCGHQYYVHFLELSCIRPFSLFRLRTNSQAMNHLPIWYCSPQWSSFLHKEQLNIMDLILVFV